MKKLFFSLTLFAGLSANAQLPAGSLAPDFTLTDINGVTHNLYTYLDQGYTVFIDVSATWCGPCWNYHNTNALEDLWVSHGPAGGNGVSANTTDDVMVIFIEGDGTTTDAELHGGAGSQGDWVTGVSHPIIDPAASIIDAFNNDYAIGYFPTIYKICPNRIINEPGQQSAANLYSGVADCPAPASDPTDVAYLSYNGLGSICGPANYTPKVTIQNNGLTPLTDATVTIKEGTTVVSTGTYTGSLNTYQTAMVTCSVIANYSGGNLSVEVTATGENNVANNTSSTTVLGAVSVKNRILLDITTDGYASETSWKIKNSSNAVVPGTTDPTLANNTTYNFVYNLTTLGCYTFSITDSYGDGITPGTINVRDIAGTVIWNDDAFGSGVDVPFKVTEIISTAGIDEATKDFIKVYPNPSKGNVTINSDILTQYSSIELVDQLGRVLGSWDVNNTQMTVDMGSVANGNYTLVFKGENGNHTQKIQINR